VLFLLCCPSPPTIRARTLCLSCRNNAPDQGVASWLVFPFWTTTCLASVIRLAAPPSSSIPQPHRPVPIRPPPRQNCVPLPRHSSLVRHSDSLNSRHSGVWRIGTLVIGFSRKYWLRSFRVVVPQTQIPPFSPETSSALWQKAGHFRSPVCILAAAGQAGGFLAACHASAMRITISRVLPAWPFVIQPVSLPSAISYLKLPWTIETESLIRFPSHLN